MAFPTTSVLDTFDRANEGPPPSASWGSQGVIAALSGLAVSSNACVDPTTQGGVYGTSYGPDSEVFVTSSIIFNDGDIIYVWLRATNPGNNTNAYTARFERKDTNPGCDIIFFRWDGGGPTQIGSTVVDTGGVLASGVKFGGEMIGTTLSAYINRSGTWALAASNSGDATYATAGQIGLRMGAGSGAMDDFGGGTVVSPPEPEPIGLFRTDRVRARRTSW